MTFPTVKIILNIEKFSSEVASGRFGREVTCNLRHVFHNMRSKTSYRHFCLVPVSHGGEYKVMR